MMIPELQLGILLLIGLVVTSGCSAHSEENNHLYDPLDPYTVLQCPNTTIEGKDGDRVILSCSTKDKMDISLEEVEWTFKDPTAVKDKNVHTYFHGEDYLHEQSDDFKDQTSLFKDQLSSGNCSLRLLVTTSHSGSYQSCVGGRLCCTVTLKVLPKGKNDTSQKHQDDTESPDDPPNGTDGQTKIQQDNGDVVAGAVIGGLVAAASIIALVVYFWRKRLKPLCPQRRNANNPPVDQEVPLQAQQPPENEES